MLPRTILGKLLFIGMGPLVLAGALCLLIGWAAFDVAHHSARHQASVLASSLAHHVRASSRAPDSSPDSNALSVVRDLLSDNPVFAPQDVTVFDAAQRPVRLQVVAPPIHWGDRTEETALAATLRDGETRHVLGTDPEEGRTWRRVVVPVKTEAGAIVGAVRLDYTLGAEVLQDIASDVLRNAALWCSVGLVTMALVAAFLARPMVSTVRRLGAATDALLRGDHVPVGNASNDELGQLARAFDGMSSQLQASMRRLQDEVKQREQAQAALEVLNAQLEARVAERTASLQASTEQLDAELRRRRRIENQLEQLARFDPLTGLPNRSLFLHRLEQALRRARQEAHMTCLLFVDLDRFKSINDTLGHDVGDAVLQEAAHRLKHALREGDLVSRIGGDEFTVVMESVHNLNAPAHVARKIVEALAPPIRVGNNEVFVSASVGIATYPNDAADIGTLMRQADLAMYQAKAEGRNGFRFHSEQLADQARSRMTIESALRQAVPRDELRLHYQMRVSAETGAHTGMEALLRWHHPEMGMVPPGNFIPVAEDTGLIVPIGEWVLRAACRQHAEWRAAGLTPGVMAVNVSARQFREADIVHTILGICAETGMPPDQLELELTESMLVSDSDDVARRMRELRDAGIGIAIDDFGTGFSSLNHLKCFPVSKIKIDRSFVRHIDTDSEDAAIAAAIVALASNLRIAITAEGVETRSQLDHLERLACTEYQGFYFNQPVPAGSATEILQRGLVPAAVLSAQSANASPAIGAAAT